MISKGLYDDRPCYAAQRGYISNKHRPCHELGFGRRPSCNIGRFQGLRKSLGDGHGDIVGI